MLTLPCTLVRIIEGSNSPLRDESSCTVAKFQQGHYMPCHAIVSETRKNYATNIQGGAQGSKNYLAWQVTSWMDTTQREKLMQPCRMS